ncbi:hypothetical protein [Ensifer adhaerens]|uniref:hypothetical protein n=1 Tax=Ensifer adhaerens TaxID=106592 RepID=UPI00156834B0|nr:hypothetical protein [Ensifer adhaerens]
MPIPRATLWAVRFCRDVCESDPFNSLHSLTSWFDSVAPCARQERIDKAKLIFGAAFAAMQKGKASTAGLLFEHGLALDPTSPLAWFYLAETREVDVVTERSWYKLAIEIGLPPELQSIAEEQLGT